MKVCDFEHEMIVLVKNAFDRRDRNNLDSVSLFLRHNGRNCDFEFNLRNVSFSGFEFSCKYTIEKEGRRVSLSNAILKTRNGDICVYPKNDEQFECKLFHIDLARYIMGELQGISF